MREARRIAADALVNGKIIKIRIGDVQVGVRPRNFDANSLSDRMRKEVGSNIPRKAALNSL